MSSLPPPPVESESNAAPMQLEAGPRRRAGWMVAGGVVVGVMLLLGAFAAGRMSRQSEIDDLEAESVELEAESEGLREDVADLEEALEAAGEQFSSTAVCREALTEGQALIDLYEQVWRAELDWWETEAGSEEEAAVEQRISELLDDIDDKVDTWADLRASCRATLPKSEAGV